MGLIFSVLEEHKGTSILEDAVARRSSFSWGIFNSQINTAVSQLVFYQYWDSKNDHNK